MELTYNQFEILTIIEREKSKLSQRNLADLSGLSLGTVNKTVSELLNENLIDNNNIITEDGLEKLEPYRVKRAIFLAAGFGSRMVPITLNTPKPLVLVKGKRIIETLLDAVVRAEIPEIIIVTGYLGEQFEVLQKKYPNIKIIENKLYNEANNISSAFLIRDKLQNSYVLESDLVLYNPNLIRKYEYESNFLGKYVKVTDDWCFETKNGIITKQKVGGYDCFQMYGISYYDAKDGKQLDTDIKAVYDAPGGKEKYWDQIPLDVCKQNYKISVRECKENDIIEIDTFNELKKIDPIYDV
jgi:CTP:phosphocholine cytidylyltransferase-like protein